MLNNLVTKRHLDEAVNELFSFLKDICESICDDDADCIKRCYSQTLRRISEFINEVDPRTTSPEQLRERIDNFRRTYRWRR
jgi:uncharacterized protein